MVIDEIAGNNSVTMKKALFRKYMYGKGYIGNKSFILVKPLTYMNNSGAVIPGILNRFRVKSENMIVICDNMDLPYGMCRIKKKGSGGGHNGLKSIDFFLNGKNYIRLFVGVSRPADGGGIVEHVLSKPGHLEYCDFINGIKKAANAAEMIMTRSVEEAMHEYNRRIT